MHLINATKMSGTYAMGLRPDGRELLVAVVKGTFTIPTDGREPTLASVQAPIVDADILSGEPGYSSTLYECDLPPVKPRCDVLLNGSAYAPYGKSVKRLTVGLHVGSMKKQFNVVGNRSWKKGFFFGVRPSSPKPFSVMPISYDNAFGGVDNLHPDSKKHVYHPSNFAGKGFFPKSRRGKITGKLLPNTEELGRSIKKPNGKYRPMALGAIGRAWQPRPTFAGTYDQAWIDHTFPFLPSDFDDRYYQAAPSDQQIDYLTGGENVTLTNLMPQSLVRFQIPKIEMPICFYPQKGQETEIQAVADTLIIEPDQERFMIVWRAAIPLRRNMFEIKQIIAGRMPKAWYRAKALGKTYYPSLNDFIKEGSTR